MRLRRLNRDDVTEELIARIVATGLQTFQWYHTDKLALLRDVDGVPIFLLEHENSAYLLHVFEQDRFGAVGGNVVGIDVCDRMALFDPNVWEVCPALKRLADKLGLTWGPALNIPYVVNEGQTLIDLVQLCKHNYLPHIRGQKSERFTVTMHDNSCEASRLQMLDDVVAVLMLCGAQRERYLRAAGEPTFSEMYPYIFYCRTLFNSSIPAGIMTVRVASELIGFLSWCVTPSTHGSVGRWSDVILLKRDDLKPLSLVGVCALHLVSRLLAMGCQRVYLGYNTKTLGDYKSRLFPQAIDHNVNFHQPLWSSVEQALAHLESLTWDE